MVHFPRTRIKQVIEGNSPGLLDGKCDENGSRTSKRDDVGEMTIEVSG